jgi:hypothetical protein
VAFSLAAQAPPSPGGGSADVQYGKAQQQATELLHQAGWVSEDAKVSPADLLALYPGFRKVAEGDYPYDMSPVLQSLRAELADKKTAGCVLFFRPSFESNVGYDGAVVALTASSTAGVALYEVHTGRVRQLSDPNKALDEYFDNEVNAVRFQAFARTFVPIAPAPAVVASEPVAEPKAKPVVVKKEEEKKKPAPRKRAVPTEVPETAAPSAEKKSAPEAEPVVAVGTPTKTMSAEPK